MLTTESITFGKYKGLTLGHVQKDRGYCKWLVDQDWFQTGYEYLYNRIKDYDPTIYFLVPMEENDENDFLVNYKYFNLVPVGEVIIPLTEVEKICYGYYIQLVGGLRDSILQRMENDDINPYDIKAPTKWLQTFERSCAIPRVEFKEFLQAYDLPNIPYIIERIKQEGGIEYMGAKSFLIAKSRSVDQEKWWEGILKDRYGESLCAQFKYGKCIFDFLNISTNTIFECKLGLKDFSGDQYSKYKLTLDKFRIIYLIGRDGVIDIEKMIVYTTNEAYYKGYLSDIPLMKSPSYLDDLLTTFTVQGVEDLGNLFGDPN